MNWRFCIETPVQRAIRFCCGSMVEDTGGGDGSAVGRGTFSYGDSYGGSARLAQDNCYGNFFGETYATKEGGWGDGYGNGNGGGYSPEVWR